MFVIAIYLAAGKSSRMGEKKLSLPIHHVSLGSIALRTILSSSIEYVLVIVNENDSLNWLNKDLINELKRGRGEIIVCCEAKKGLGYSLKCGITKAMEMNAEQVIVCLADQPFIKETMLHTLQMQAMSANDDYVASSHKGLIKPPIIFAAKTFRELLQIKGDFGAKKIIAKGLLQGKKIEFSDELNFADIDTKEDYQKYLPFMIEKLNGERGGYNGNRLLPNDCRYTDNAR